MQLPDMKQMIFITLAIVGMFGCISCERHEWEDKDGYRGTKHLYPSKEKKESSGHDHCDHDQNKH